MPRTKVVGHVTRPRGGGGVTGGEAPRRRHVTLEASEDVGGGGHQRGRLPGTLTRHKSSQVGTILAYSQKGEGAGMVG